LLLCEVLRPRAVAAPAVQQSIDISYPPGTQQQTRRTLLQPLLLLVRMAKQLV